MLTLLELFDSLSRNYGEHDAVTSSMSSWCYAEISFSSDALAAQLVYRFGTPDILLMDLNRCAAAELATVIACMRLGILFCPVDGTDPLRLKQIAQVLRNGRVGQNRNGPRGPAPRIAAAVLANNDRDPRLTSFYHAGIHFCILLNEAGEMLEPMSVPSMPPKPSISQDSDDLYILFTSGTTSKSPKAVIGSRKETLRRLQWFVDEIHDGEKNVVIARRTPLVFIDGIHELLSVLLHSAPLAKIYCGVALMDLVQHSTRVSMLPSQLAQLVERRATRKSEERSPLDVIVVSGEPCPCSVVQKFKSNPLFSKTRLYNFYGQTETVGDICYSNLSNDAIVDGTVPVGCLLPGVSLELTEGTNEVVVTHGSFANGYYNSNEAICPFRTGDEGFYRGSSLYIRGRLGDVQKVNGILTSPTEVEARFQSVFGNSPCAATILGGASYILTEQADVSSSFSRQRMRDAQVPWNLIPKGAFSIHSLPRTNSGKIQRGQVQDVVKNRLQWDQVGAAGARNHSLLVQAMSDVLSISTAQIDARSQSSFVDLGGDSHLAVALWHKFRALDLLDDSSEVEPIDLLWAPDANTLQSLVEGRLGAKRRRTANGAALTFKPSFAEKTEDNHYCVRFPGCVDATPLHCDGYIYNACQSGVIQRIEVKVHQPGSPTAFTLSHGWRVQSSLVACFGTIIACCHHTTSLFGLVVCINKQLTTTTWERQLPNAIKATPLVQEDCILVQSGNVLFALDSSNGAIVARITLGGVSECCPVPIVSLHSTKILYVFSTWSCSCEVIEFRGGHFSRATIEGLDTPIRADPLFLRPHQIFAADILGNVHLIDTAAKTVTSSKISSAAFCSTPARTVEGDIVLGCNDGVVRCLSQADLAVILWELDVGAAIVNKIISTKTNEFVVCTNAGQVLRVSLGSGSPSAAQIAKVMGEIWSDPLLVKLGSHNEVCESDMTSRRHSGKEKPVADESIVFGARDSGLHVVRLQ